ncbi:serine hydrolase [bacterium]|nr:MAG: serine hydrolase [bacterium]
MGLLKQAESDPSLLSRRLLVDLPPDRTPLLIPADARVEAGKVYTVEELLELVVAHSDNVALDALYTLQLRPVYDRVFADLGLSAPPPAAPEARMRVKDYATFFRILYNASYLTREMSEKALGILARSSFRQGLPSGVPAGVPVAHKFGERTSDGGPELQLHDCGIVYHPKTPYVLCVMTRGPKLVGLLSTIRRASALAYAEVDAR